MPAFWKIIIQTYKGLNFIRWKIFHGWHTLKRPLKKSKREELPTNELLSPTLITDLVTQLPKSKMLFLRMRPFGLMNQKVFLKKQIKRVENGKIKAVDKI